MTRGVRLLAAAITLYLAAVAMTAGFIYHKGRCDGPFAGEDVGTCLSAPMAALWPVYWVTVGTMALLDWSAK